MQLRKRLLLLPNVHHVIGSSASTGMFLLHVVHFSILHKKG